MHVKSFPSARQPARALLGVALAATASAQVFNGANDFDLGSNVASPAAPFRNAVALDFNGDQLTDVAQIVGEQLVIYWAPGTYEAEHPSAVIAQDAAAYRTQGSEADHLLIIQDDTLKWVAYDPDGVTVPPQGSPIQGGFDAHLIPGVSFMLAANRVIVADMDNDGDQDGVIICGTLNRGIQVIENLEEIGPDQFQGGPVLADTGVLFGYDLAVADTDGDGLMEIAISGSNGARSWEYDHNAGSFSAVVNNGAAAFGATNPLCGLSSDSGLGLVPYIGANPNQDEFLTTFDNNGPNGLTPLGNIGAVALVGADFDLDGHEDMVLSHQSAYEFLIALQQEAPNPGDPHWTLSPTQFFTVDLGRGVIPAAENVASPSAGDYDLDGDIDLFMGIQVDGSLRVVFNGHIDAQSARPSLDPIEVKRLDATGANQASLIEVTVPFDLSNVPARFTHLKWFVRRAIRDTSHGSVYQMQPEIVEGIGDWTSLNTGPLEVAFEWDTSAPQADEEVLVFTARYAELDAQDQPLSQGPHVTFAYVHDDGRPAHATDAKAYVTGLIGATPLVPITYSPNGQTGFANGAGEGEQAGGASPVDCLPTGCAEPNEIPPRPPTVPD